MDSAIASQITSTSTAQSHAQALDRPVPLAQSVQREAAAAEAAARQRVAQSGESAESAMADKRASKAGEGMGLDEADEALLKKLSSRDREVRAHEQAHAAVGGRYAGSPTYTYQSGPDGQRYAIGGEVKIDVSPVPGDPEATIEKMRIVAAAALAPAEPSAADRRVAALARAQIIEAQAEASYQESKRDTLERATREYNEALRAVKDTTVSTSI